MIIVTRYTKQVKDGIIIFTGTEEIPCPVCGGKLKQRGTCLRKVREENETVVYSLRVMECTKCGKTHRELPFWVVPYKRIAAPVLSDIARSDNKNLEKAEGSTWHRIKEWITWFLNYAMNVLQALLVSDAHIQTVPTGASLCKKLEYFVRLVANSGRWISHRSAMQRGF